MGDNIVEYYRGYYGDTRSLDHGPFDREFDEDGA